MKVLVYPKANNPYQDLLYSNSEFKITVKYLELPKNLLSFFTIYIKLLIFRFRGFSIFHLHWTYPFIILDIKKGKFLYFRKVINSIYFLFFILFLKLIKYKLVWTIHNIQPHESEFVDDIYLMKYLAHFSDAKIIHSSYIINVMNELGYSIKNVHIIEIANYIDVYKNSSTKKVSRKKLNIPEKAFVFLFFGLIREYKGIEELLESYKVIVKTNKDVFLIIAGKVFSDNLINEIYNFKKNYSNNLFIKTTYIPDDEVQYYFNSCDVVVLPFLKITTSSTAVLALSFSKPIVYPKIGNLVDIPSKFGFAFNAGSISSLTASMQTAIDASKNLEDIGKNAYEYIAKITWEKSARKTIQVYKLLFKTKTRL